MIFDSSIPIWLPIVFSIAIGVPVYLIVKLVKKAFPKEQLHLKVLFFYVLYFGYVLFMTYQGMFATESLPPRIILFTMLPLLTFYFLVVRNMQWLKNLLEKVSLQDLIGLHIFRLIGGTFLLLWGYGKLPKVFGLIPGLGDIFTAIASIYAAKKSTNRKLVLAWNVFGLLDILATTSLAMILTKKAIETGSLGVEILTTIPFCLIPAFAPATIIFLHFIVFQKLLKD